MASASFDAKERLNKLMKLLKSEVEEGEWMYLEVGDFVLVKEEGERNNNNVQSVKEKTEHPYLFQY